MRCKRIGLALALLVVVLLTSGCWDRKEIENRGYVLGVGIDSASPNPTGRYDLERAFQETGKRKYRLTYELRKFRTEKGGEKAGGGAEQGLTYSAEAESLFAATRAINSQTNFSMFLEDIQAMVVSEEVARQGLKEVFDFFDRDPEMRRRTRVFITQERAEDLLTHKSKSGELNSLAIAKLDVNAKKKTPTIGIGSEFGYIAESINAKQGFSIPMLYLEKDILKAAGSALFNRQAKLVAVADEYEEIGNKILRGKLEYGLIVVQNPGNPESVLVFELFESKIKLKPDFSQEAVRVLIEGDFIGSVGEKIPIQNKLMDAEYYNAAAKAVSEELTKHVYAALNKAQSMKVDTIEFGSMIRRKNPKYWEAVKTRWEEEIFPTVQANTHFKVKIRGTGMVF